MAQKKEKSGQLSNFPAQQPENLPKSRRNRQILRISYTKRAVPIFSQRQKLGHFPQISLIWDNVLKIGTNKGPAIKGIFSLLSFL